MLTIDNEKMINKYINQLISKTYNTENKEIITELKLRIWQQANNITQQTGQELTEDTIKQLIKNIDNIDQFINQSENTKFDWALNKIVDEKLCAKCSTCSIVCPNQLIDFKESPEIHEECLRKGNGMCMEVCPRQSTGSYAVRTRLNLTEEYYYGKGTMQGQSGGVVTTFLKGLIDDKKIDGAIVVGDNHWKPVSMIVTDAEGLEDSMKSKYAISSMDAIRKAGEMGLEKIAVVGLPCQVAGLRNIQYHPYIAKHGAERGRNGKKAKIPEIEYIIGLFCTEKFEHTEVLRVLEENNIDINDVTKFDVKGPNFVVTTSADEVKIKIKELKASSGCKMCRDFDAELADVSIGDKGSPDGTSTIIIRTDKGRDIGNYIQLEEGIEQKDLNFMRNFKMKRFQKEITRREENNEYNSYYYIWKHGGVSKGRNGLCFIRFRAYISGYYDTELIRKITEVADKYEAIVKLTNRMEFELQEVQPKYVEDIVREFEECNFKSGSEGPLVRSVVSCPGEEHCNLGLINTRELARKIEEDYSERPATYKFKFNVSGCPNKCVRPSISDFGVNGVKFPLTNDLCVGCGRCQDVCKTGALEIRGDTAVTNYDICIGCGKCINACPNDAKDIKFKGYAVYIGGRGGRKTVVGQKIYVEDEDELINTIHAVFKTYNKYSEKPQKERLCTTMQRVGNVKFINEVEKAKNELSS
ncbi:Coenzyme F420 hydrogenase/dehydrogenase, beta subunit C-terminal domain [Methanosphaera sp.]